MCRALLEVVRSGEKELFISQTFLLLVPVLARALFSRIPTCVSCSLVLGPVRVRVPGLWHCANAGDQQLPKKQLPSCHVHAST